MPAITPRNRMPNTPAQAVYTPPTSGMPNRTRIPIVPMPSSRKAYTRSGCSREEMTRGSTMLPRHMPPINVPSSTARETADDPMTSSSSWNQTIS